jgi:site-specific recombinase XerD
MFLFALYAHGMRFGDVATLGREQIKKTSLMYTMHKTGKDKDIKMPEQLQAIIERYKHNTTPYLFPIIKEEIKLDKNDNPDEWDRKAKVSTALSIINLRLKRVGLICGIDKNISTHIARHSFAAIYLDYKDGDLKVLRELLAHSNFKTTQRYAGQLQADKVNQSLVNFYEQF